MDAKLDGLGTAVLAARLILRLCMRQAMLAAYGLAAVTSVTSLHLHYLRQFHNSTDDARITRSFPTASFGLIPARVISARRDLDRVTGHKRDGPTSLLVHVTLPALHGDAAQHGHGANFSTSHAWVSGAMG